MAGYSHRSLGEKLGIRSGMRIHVIHQPAGYEHLLNPLPEGVHRLRRLTDNIDLLHLFTSSRAQLESLLPLLLPRVRQNGSIWISWPKKSAKVPTDVTEDVVRDVAIPLGLVDVKVCAVDDVWSGLKLVRRKENRTPDLQTRHV